MSRSHSFACAICSLETLGIIITSGKIKCKSRATGIDKIPYIGYNIRENKLKGESLTMGIFEIDTTTKLVIITIIILIVFIAAFLSLGSILDLLPKKRKDSGKSNENSKEQQGYITEAEHEQEITKIKYQIGRKVLVISMIAMSLFVFIDILVSTSPDMESELINNAFEAFKLITMTVLGYVFGSNDSKK